MGLTFTVDYVITVAPLGIFIVIGLTLSTKRVISIIFTPMWILRDKFHGDCFKYLGIHLYQRHCQCLLYGTYPHYR